MKNVLRIALITTLFLSTGCASRWVGEWEGELIDCSLGGADLPEDAYDVELTMEREGNLGEFDWVIRDMLTIDVDGADLDADFERDSDGFVLEATGEVDINGEDVDIAYLFELDYTDRDSGEGDFELEIDGDTISCDLELER